MPIQINTSINAEHEPNLFSPNGIEIPTNDYELGNDPIIENTSSITEFISKWEIQYNISHSATNNIC